MNVAIHYNKSNNIFGEHHENYRIFKGLNHHARPREKQNGYIEIS